MYCGRSLIPRPLHGVWARDLVVYSSLASGANRCYITTPQWETMGLSDDGCYTLPNPKSKYCMPFEVSMLLKTIKPVITSFTELASSLSINVCNQSWIASPNTSFNDFSIFTFSINVCNQSRTLWILHWVASQKSMTLKLAHTDEKTWGVATCIHQHLRFFFFLNEIHVNILKLISPMAIITQHTGNKIFVSKSIALHWL